MLRRSIYLAVLTLGWFLQTSPVPLHAFYLEPAGLAPVALPAGIISVTTPARADFNHDGLPETLALAKDRLTIFSGSEPVWESPAGWTVIQAHITDLNRDGIPEAALLVWRPFRPWPVDRWLPHGGRIAAFQDNEGKSCQIILVGWRGRAYTELWAGSALAEPVKTFAAADLNGDHAQELVTLEGSYADPRSAPARVLKVWEWNGFGFTVVSMIEGKFDKLALVQVNADRVLIIVP
jgi:hypothetical protein